MANNQMTVDTFINVYNDADNTQKESMILNSMSKEHASFLEKYMAAQKMVEKSQVTNSDGEVYLDSALLHLHTTLTVALMYTKLDMVTSLSTLSSYDIYDLLFNSGYVVKLQQLVSDDYQDLIKLRDEIANDLRIKTIIEKINK